jgi:aspartate kinase
MQSVTIWKDVPGVMNADPRYFENASLLKPNRIREAIELAFYGATVIHPKTLHLYKRNSFICKSFINPLLKGQRLQGCLEFYLVFIVKEINY